MSNSFRFKLMCGQSSVWSQLPWRINLVGESTSLANPLKKGALLPFVVLLVPVLLVPSTSKVGVEFTFLLVFLLDIHIVIVNCEGILFCWPAGTGCAQHSNQTSCYPEVIEQHSEYSRYICVVNSRFFLLCLHSKKELG